MPWGVEPGIKQQVGASPSAAFLTAVRTRVWDHVAGSAARAIGSVFWLVSYGREAVVFAAGWWLLGVWLSTLLASLLVAVAGLIWLVLGSRVRAVEAERRDLLQVARRWPAHPRVRLAGREAWAFTSTGRVIGPLAPGNHLLLGGMSGAGKSTAVNGLLFLVAPWPHVHMVGIDLKDGLELSAWTPRMDAMVKDHAAAVVLLERVSDLIHQRNESLERHGIADRGFAYKSVDDAIAATGKTWPRLLVVLDELQELVQGHEAIKDMLASIARRGRSAGVDLISTTQLPSAQAIGSTYRAQHGVNVVMRVRSRQDADVMAGQGVLGERERLEERGLWVPWEGNIQPPERRDAGRALLVADGEISEVRFVYRSDAEISDRALATAGQVGPKLIDLPASGGGRLAEHRRETRARRPDGEPSTSWSRAQLNEAIAELGGTPFDIQGPKHRHSPTRQQMVDEINRLKVSA